MFLADVLFLLDIFINQNRRTVKTYTGVTIRQSTQTYWKPRRCRQPKVHIHTEQYAKL